MIRTFEAYGIKDKKVLRTDHHLLFYLFNSNDHMLKEKNNLWNWVQREVIWDGTGYVEEYMELVDFMDYLFDQTNNDVKNVTLFFEMEKWRTSARFKWEKGVYRAILKNNLLLTPNKTTREALFTVKFFAERKYSKAMFEKCLDAIPFGQECLAILRSHNYTPNLEKHFLNFHVSSRRRMVMEASTKTHKSWGRLSFRTFIRAWNNPYMPPTRPITYERICFLIDKITEEFPIRQMSVWAIPMCTKKKRQIPHLTAVTKQNRYSARGLKQQTKHWFKQRRNEKVYKNQYVEAVDFSLYMHVNKAWRSLRRPWWAT